MSVLNALEQATLKYQLSNPVIQKIHSGRHKFLMDGVDDVEITHFLQSELDQKWPITNAQIENLRYKFCEMNGSDWGDWILAI